MPDPFNALVLSMNELISSNMSIFVGMGQRLFAGFATIMLAWFGIQTALSASEGGPNLAQFSRLLMLIAFGFAMSSAYDTAIPGIGMSFTELIRRQAEFLSTQIGQATATEITRSATGVMKNMAPPSVVNLHEVMTYLVIYLALATVQAAIFMVLGFGIVAQGVLLLLGPVFVPFFIVPKLDWLAWGWLRSFLQYSFFQVVANAFVFIFGRLLLRFLALNVGGMTATEWMAQFPALIILILVFLYGILKIPTLTNHLFSGTSGGDTGFTQVAVRALTRA